MFNNKLLDWKFDNGISTYMTADKNRNQFMDRVLARTVKDKNCVDIGFGTGLLSFLAVKHGAKHVTAFEFNYERYLLGQYLIEKMGLQDQITLHNARFEYGLIPNGCDLVFQEIFDQEFWADGLAFCASNHDLPMVPSRYRCEFYLADVSDELLQQFFNSPPSTPPSQTHFIAPAVTTAIRREKEFDFYNQSLLSSNFTHYIPSEPFTTGVAFPGVDVYTEEIKNFLDESWLQQKAKKIHQISNVGNKIIDRTTYTNLVNSGIKVADYEFDYISNTLAINDARGNNISELDRSKMYIDLTLPADPFKNKVSILLTINTIAHEELELVITPVVTSQNPPSEGINRLYSMSGWDLPMSHSVFVDPFPSDQTELYARQYLDSGVTRFWYD